MGGRRAELAYQQLTAYPPWVRTKAASFLEQGLGPSRWWSRIEIPENVFDLGVHDEQDPELGYWNDPWDSARDGLRMQWLPNNLIGAGFVDDIPFAATSKTAALEANTTREREAMHGRCTSAYNYESKSAVRIPNELTKEE
ncbi:hypothetical protein EYR36_006753 [Pleurotus pulmonarius]|nr:hypothetical protein EYR36_006753 [Pleurotus pulmonarius]